jgi:hypothetical protein
MAISLTFEDPAYPGMAVDVEDDGNVAYAYFMKDGETTGHVWLYNHPDGVPNPWNSPLERGSIPTNVEGYFDAEGFQPIESEDEVEVMWGTYGGYVSAGVYLRRKILGIVADDLKPGWSRLATKGSPVAQPLLSSPS